MKCLVENCDKTSRCRGYCNTHYSRYRRHGDASIVLSKPRAGRSCSVEGCGEGVDSRGMCGKHYMRVRRYGNPNHVTSTEDFRLIVRMTRPNLGNIQPHVYQKYLGRHLHRRVAEQKIGRPLRDGEIVHHRDGNLRNNHPDNLEVLQSQSVHARRHKLGHRRKFASGPC